MSEASNELTGTEDNFLEKYRFWLTSDYFDAETKRELLAIENDPAEIENRFFKGLEFGTGGMRGVMEAGTDRMNIYTVRNATQGFAQYLRTLYGNDHLLNGVVIAYDSRRNSYTYALESARVLAGNGIKVYVFDSLRPTPELSFAVKYLEAAGGIVITASHNPKEYNGYKVYGPDGAQMSVSDSDLLESSIRSIRDITEIMLANLQIARDSGLITDIGKEIDDEFIKSLKTLRIHPEMPAETLKNVNILYTPLYGAGNKLVRRLLSEVGFKVDVVSEQELPDCDFPTAPYPNPEDIRSFDSSIKKAKITGADLLLATDPDSDRLGVVVRNGEQYVQLTGNQVGCLLMDYILAGKKQNGLIPDNAFVVKTIVSTGMAVKIAKYYGVEIIEVLTGFKFIGEQIKLLQDNGNKKYVFGFEESIGYLSGTFSRDKDGVGASMLVSEMAAYNQQKGLTLLQAIKGLSEVFGYMMTGTINKVISDDKSGMDKISRAMTSLRKKSLDHFGSFRVIAVRDYLDGKRWEINTERIDILNLPQSNVLYYELDDDAWVCFRPSGTEPKIKIYYEICDKIEVQAHLKFLGLESALLPVIDSLFDV